MDLKIDDLLEKVSGAGPDRAHISINNLQNGQQKDNKHLLDLEYVQLNVVKVLALLNKVHFQGLQICTWTDMRRPAGLPEQIETAARAVTDRVDRLYFTTLLLPPFGYVTKPV
jgi:hypothetical protein